MTTAIILIIAMFGLGVLARYLEEEEIKEKEKRGKDVSENKKHLKDGNIFRLFF